MTEPYARARVAIVGTGFSGLGMAIRLKQAGMHDFIVLEKADDVGGTWRENTYPGAACDVPSHLYSFSFAPNPNWPESFSAQPEIQAYLRRCADRFGVRAHIRFGCELRESAWDDAAQVWRLDTSQGEVVANFLVASTGGLHEPKLPDIPGLADFTGTMFHTAQWRHDHDLAGERVAVIGTGASSVQVAPQIAPIVGTLEVYQRTASWIMPRVNRRISDAERRLYRRVPLAQKAVRTALYLGHETFVLGLAKRPQLIRGAERIARRHLARQVPDPQLRAQLTPHYRMGCKRVVVSSDFYPALSRPNVSLVTSGIRQVRATSIVTEDGVDHPTDTIVFGTGFYVTDATSAQHIRGRGGQLLADAWRDGLQAYAGACVAGFPNLFLVTGPNTGIGHSSLLIMIEAEIGYVLDALRVATERGAAEVEVRADAQRAYNDALQSKMPGTVWATGGCNSWYLDAHGRNTSLWPDFTWRFRRRVRRFDEVAYTLRPGLATTLRERSALPG